MIEWILSAIVPLAMGGIIGIQFLVNRTLRKSNDALWESNEKLMEVNEKLRITIEKMTPYYYN